MVGKRLDFFFFFLTWGWNRLGFGFVYLYVWLFQRFGGGTVETGEFGVNGVQLMHKTKTQLRLKKNKKERNVVW